MEESILIMCYFYNQMPATIVEVENYLEALKLRPVSFRAICATSVVETSQRLCRLIFSCGHVFISPEHGDMFYGKLSKLTKSNHG